MKKLVSVLLALIMLMTVIPFAAADQPKLVALTFDDGPGPYTEKLLDGLAEYGVRATFFCQGSRAELYPELIQRIVNEGHQLANHSYNHPNFNELSVDSALYQISRTDAIFNEITGLSESCYVRPPYGNTTWGLRQRMTAPAILWSVDTIDWQLLNSEAVKNKILNDTFDGSIVLMHDIHRTTVDAVLAAMDTLASRGYEFVTVKELFRRRGIIPAGGEIYQSVKPSGTDAGPLIQPEIQVYQSGDSMELSFISPSDAPVYYTLDGSPVTCHSERYLEPVIVELPCSIRAVAAWDLNGDRSIEVVLDCTQPMAQEPVVYTEGGDLVMESDHRVFVSLDGETWEEWEKDLLPRDTWFSYYADGEGLAPSPVRTYLYTAQGNLTADLQQTDWYYGAMDHGVARGYFQPDSSLTVHGEGIVTRAMLAQLLYRHSGEGAAEQENPFTFTDVPLDAWYADAILWGFENGILNGVGGGRFEPERPVSRQELAKILTGYLQLEPAMEPLVYEDHGQISPWASDAVAAVTATGLMMGDKGCFRPLGTATRAEVATLLMRIDLNT